MRRIEDYAIISNCQSAALISSHGSIDWLCFPNFDSPASFASLLGKEENGLWKISPAGKFTSSRSYEEDTLILETIFSTSEGKASVIDFMTMDEDCIEVIRMVKCLSGKVEMQMTYKPRFDYGSRLPLILNRDSEAIVVCGPEMQLLSSSEKMNIENHCVFANLSLVEGKTASFRLGWSPSHKEIKNVTDINTALENTKAFWKNWMNDCAQGGCKPENKIIQRSLLTLKALTFRPTGSIVAAVTTSMPEAIGEERNWDYRYCWPRDAALAMKAVAATGQMKEIDAWRHWLLRATAGLSHQMEVLYTLHGGRPKSEETLDWLDGHEKSTPVRIGNNAHDQLQLDIYGIVIEIIYMSHHLGLSGLEKSWDLARSMLEHLEEIWQKPDEGIWEVRGPARHFVHSKLMVWLAYDCCIKAVEEFNIEGPVEHWKKLRQQVHEEIMAKGFNKKINSFAQFYGSEDVDASLLLLPIFNFIDANDPKMIGTVEKIEKDLLLEEGLIMRYRPNEEVEGMPDHGKRAFLVCCGWLGEVYVLQDKIEHAKKVFEKLCSLTNDVGLLAEQYDPKTKRQLGNFPQAFSHIALMRLEDALKTEKKV
jgi:GH15 family glucan-1,4-alpha-glucosidase